jgi:hypothetical protein
MKHLTDIMIDTYIISPTKKLSDRLITMFRNAVSAEKN